MAKTLLKLLLKQLVYYLLPKFQTLWCISTHLEHPQSASWASGWKLFHNFCSNHTFHDRLGSLWRVSGIWYRQQKLQIVLCKCFLKIGLPKEGRQCAHNDALSSVPCFLQQAHLDHVWISQWEGCQNLYFKKTIFIEHWMCLRSDDLILRQTRCRKLHRKS